MPTAKTVYVDPDASGSNNGTSWTNAYTGLFTGWDTETGGSPNVVTSTDLVTNDEIVTFLCRSSSGTGDTSMDEDAFSTGINLLEGFTTDATRYPIVRGDSSLSTGGLDKTLYWMDWNSVAGTRACCVMNNSYLRVQDIQIELGCGHGGQVGIWVGPQTNMLLERFIVQGVVTSGDSSRGVRNDGGSGCVIRNGLIYDFTGAGTGNSGFYEMDDFNANDVSTYNLTIHNCQVGVNFSEVNSNNFYNILIQDCTDGWSGTALKAEDCISISGDTINAVTTARLTYSNSVAFENEGGDDFRLSSSDTVAKGAGQDFSGSFTDDLLGNTRPATWDIGAFNAVSGRASLVGSALTDSPLIS